MSTGLVAELRLTEDWHRGVVAVLDSGTPVGTGFVVDRLNKLVVTCAHVLAAAGWQTTNPGETVDVYFLASETRLEATVDLRWYRPETEGDIAVLYTGKDLPASVHVLPLANAVGISEHTVYTVGHPNGHRNGLLGTGTVLGVLNNRLQLNSTEITKGYSGGPVWDANIGRVIGMVTAGTKPDALGRLGSTAFAAPVELLRAVCDKLVVTATPIVADANIPRLPPHFLPRDTDLATVKTVLLQPQQRGETLRLRARAVGIHGGPGAGKTVLTAALAKDKAVQDRFPDGVFWLTVGQNPNLLEKLAHLAQALGDTTSSFHGLEDGREGLRIRLKDRRFLLVLDDVWSPKHVASLDVLDGEASAGYLLTSRRKRLLERFGPAYELQKLSRSQALALLAHSAGKREADILSDATARTQALAVAEACHYLPLALAMLGAMVRDHADPWARALRILSKEDLGRIHVEDFPYPNLKNALAASIDGLADETHLASLSPKERYWDLAVFPEDMRIPRAVLDTFWAPAGLEDIDIDDLIAAWVDRYLVTIDDANRVSLHDLQGMFVRQMAVPLAPRHARLVEAYAGRSVDGWAGVPADTYFHSGLTYHLAAAGRSEEARDLLLDFGWLEAQLQENGAPGLLTDFARIPDELKTAPVRRLYGLVRMIGSQLATLPNQLAGQLLGRLADVPEMPAALLAAARAWDRTAWLRPRWATLIAPGGALLADLTAHTDQVYGVAVSANDQLAVSVSEDRTALIWHIESGQLVHTLAGHRRGVNHAVITPDGARVITAGRDRAIKIWDMDTGEHITDLADGHTSEVWRLAISADGRWMASAGWDKEVIIWDLADNHLHRRLIGHTGAVMAVVLDETGYRAVSADEEGGLIFWDVDQARAVAQTDGQDGRIYDLCLSENGRWLAAAGHIGPPTEREHVVSWRQLADGALIHTFPGHSDRVSYVRFAPEDRYLLSASADGTLKIWDLEARRLADTLPDHKGPVVSAAISADGERIVSVGEDRTVRIWSRDKARLLSTMLGHSDLIVGVSLTSDGRRAITASFDETVKVWDLAPAELRVDREPNHAAPVTHLALDAAGVWALSGAEDGAVCQIVLATGESTTIPAGTAGAVNGLALSADGQWAARVDDSDQITVWPTAAPADVRLLPGHHGGAHAVCWHPDGDRLITGGADRSILVTPVRAAGRVVSLPGHTSGIERLTVSPDGTLVASSSRTESGNGVIRLWYLSKTALEHPLTGHTNAIAAMLITADNKWLISASADYSVRVWNIETGQRRHFLTGHTAAVTDITFAGQWLLSSSHDETIRVWDPSSGDLITTLSGHRGTVTTVAAPAAPAGTHGIYAVSGGRDRVLRVWDVAQGQTVSAFSCDGAITCLVGDEAGRLFVAGDGTGRVHVLDLRYPGAA